MTRPLLMKQATAVHCPQCYRYQLVEKRHDNGKLRLACHHKIKAGTRYEVCK